MECHYWIYVQGSYIPREEMHFILYLSLYFSSVLCDHLEEWDREGGRETQEGGGMGIYVYV